MAPHPDLTLCPGGLSPEGPADRETAARGGLRFRAPGQIGEPDLASFLARGGGVQDRPALVTALLSACSEPALEARGALSLTISARIGGLLAIWVASLPEGEAEGETGALEIGARCAQPGCGGQFGFDLPAEALMDMAREAEAVPVLTLDGLTLRRPTGADQQLWRSARPADPEGAILASLIRGQPVPGDPAARAALSEQLADFDPLSCFTVSLSCPDCGLAQDLPVDLEAELLHRIALVQDRIFRDIDILARRYGWSENEILALRPERRARYLRLAQEDAASTGEGWM